MCVCMHVCTRLTAGACVCCSGLSLWKSLVKSLVCRSHAKAPRDEVEGLVPLGGYPCSCLMRLRGEEDGLTQGRPLNHSAPRCRGARALAWGSRTSLSLPLSLVHFIEHLLCSRSFTEIPSIKSSQRSCEVSAISTCFPDEKSGTSRDALQSHWLPGVGLQLKLRLDGQQVHHHDYSTG